MNWDQFEDRMKTGLSDPPTPNRQEVDASWDRLEPKLFPKRRRALGWFSLNTVLLLILATVGGLSVWFTQHRKASTKPTTKIENHGSGWDANQDETDEAPQTATNTATYSSNSNYTEDADAVDQSPYDDVSTEVPAAQSSRKSTSKANKTKESRENTIASADPREADRTTKLNTPEPADATNSPGDKKPTKKSKSKSKNSNTDDINSTTLVAEAKPSTEHGPRPAETMTPQIITTGERSTQTEVVKTETAAYMVITEHVDSENVVSRMRTMDITDAVAEESAPVVEGENEGLNLAETKSRKTKISSIRNKNESENEQTKIRKASVLSLYGAANFGTKAAYPTMGGVMGLEWMQELTQKFSLIAGLRYKLTSLSASVTDSSIQFYDMRVDSVDPNQSTVTMYFTNNQKKYKVTQLNAIQIPIYVNYDIVKQFSMQLGINLEYLLSSKHKVTDEWTGYGNNASTMSTAQVPTTMEANKPYLIAEKDFGGKFGVGLHVGAQYLFSERFYARFAYSQLLKNYYTGYLRDAIGPYSKSPTIQVGLGFRFSGTKK